jgi:chemotaxis signal transduction protein
MRESAADLLASDEQDRAGTGVVTPDWVLLGWLGARRVGLPLHVVERILQMVALTPLPDASAGVAGVVDVMGDMLPVVDPRPRFALPSPPGLLEQRLVMIQAGTRYLLWLDSVERILVVPPDAAWTTQTDAEASVVSHLFSLDGEVIALLSPAALDPGPMLHAAGHQP